MYVAAARFLNGNFLGACISRGAAVPLTRPCGPRRQAHKEVRYGDFPFCQIQGRKSCWTKVRT